jgi:hypothetical protein
MTAKVFIEYFIMVLPYAMAAVFVVGAFFRGTIWYTVRRHEWFAREFEKRVNSYVEKETPQQGSSVSFYALSKKMLERTYYEAFSLRDRLQRRKGDAVMSIWDRLFLIKPGCAWLVKDLLKQVKFLKWTEETPKLQHITKATLHHNPCFNRVFGLIPMTALNDLISILPGLFVVAGILGTFVGIAGGLQELGGGMSLQDLENTKNVMDRFLYEISYAMKTSIAGIVFSLAAHIFNVIFSPERVYVSLVDRMESSLDLLWYRSDNNNFPPHDREFDEHRDPAEALAEESVNAEVSRHSRSRGMDEVRKVKAS